MNQCRGGGNAAAKVMDAAIAKHGRGVIEN